MDFDTSWKDVVLGLMEFKASRSGGKGGQHVNKVETKVEAWVTISQLTCFTDEMHLLLRENLGNRINNHDQLKLVVSESRSQYRNKELAKERLVDLIKQNLVKTTERKATKVPRAVKRKILDNKRRKAETKSNRNKNWRRYL